MSNSGSESVILDLMPIPGSYVVFSIDAVETLRAINDPEVTAAAKKIPTKKYVGYVETWINDLDRDAPYLALTLLPLAQGLPSRSEEDCIEPEMCVPVLPNTDHPWSREPVQPSRPLPWPNCYHYSVMPSVTLRVAKDFVDASNAVTLAYKETSRLDQMRRDDQIKSESMRTNRSGANVLSQVNILGRCAGKIDAPQDPCNEIVQIPAARDGTPAENDFLSSASSDFSQSDVLDLQTYFDNIMVNTRPSDTMPVATVSYDLAALSVLADPKDLLEEQSSIKKLEKYFEARTMERLQDMAVFEVTPQQTERKGPKSFDGRNGGKKSLIVRGKSLVIKFIEKRINGDKRTSLNLFRRMKKERIDQRRE